MKKTIILAASFFLLAGAQARRKHILELKEA